MDRLGEDLLHCSICFDRFKSPKVLQCCHSFCESCLGRHHAQGSQFRQAHLSIICPKCRDISFLPENGIAGLRDDVAVDKMAIISEKIQTILDGISNLTLAVTQDGDNALKLKGVHNAVCGLEHNTTERKHLEQLVVTLGEKAGDLYNCLLQLSLTEKVTRKDYTKDVASLQAKCSDFWTGLNGEEVNHEASANIEDIDYDDEKSKLDDRYGPILAQLSRQQDRLYNRYSSLKVLYEITDEVLVKCTTDQIAAISSDLITIIERDIERHSLKSNEGGLYLNPQSLMVKYSTVGLQGPEKDVFDFVFSDVEPYSHEEWRCNLIWKVEGRGEGRGEFDWPVHAQFMPNNDVAVCDKNNKRLQILDCNGNFIRYIGQGLIKPKRAVCHPSNGLIYVSDELSTGVKVFDGSDKLVNRFGTGLYKYPAGIAVMSDGNVVMSDAERGFISVHSPDGCLVTKFFARMLDDLELPNPFFLCVDDDDNIIATDSSNHCVKYYNNKGRPLYKFGMMKLNCPRGICLDLEGNILIADSDNHRVAMFDPYGKFLRNLLSASDGISSPMSIEMNSEGRLLVSQCGYYGNHEIRMYKVSCTEVASPIENFDSIL